MGHLLGGFVRCINWHIILNSILSVLGVDLASIGGMLPSVIEPLQILLVILGAISLSLLATVFPSYRAAAVRPAEALRYE